MDLWTYLRGLKRWWWLVIVIPVAAFALASVVVPPAKWTVTWTSAIVMNGDPNAANRASVLEYVLLDDMTHLLHSDVLGDLVYLQLPDSITSDYSRSDVGEMFVYVMMKPFSHKIIKLIFLQMELKNLRL